MSRMLYSLLFYLLLPLVLLRLLYRAKRAPEYASRWRERFGFFSAPKLTRPIWIHAVSVGETIAAAPIVESLLAARPERPIVVTTMTPTGSDRVHAMFGDRVFHVYAPYDLPDAVLRFLNRIDPAMLVIMETELWPNMVALSRRRGIPVVLANARLSERSARGYRRVRWVAEPLMHKLNMIMAQSEADAARFRTLAVPADQVPVTGSLKYDIDVDDALIQRGKSWRNYLGPDRPVWVAASTHDGEDEHVLAAHHTILKHFPEALLVLIPRHPERFASVAALSESQGFRTELRSRLPMDKGAEDAGLSANCQVVIGDSMGEMLVYLAAADLVFMGGSLVPHGGHNPLEPAALAKPVLSGPHVFNFADITDRLVTGEGLLLVDDADALAAQVVALLNDPEMAASAGRCALRVLEENRGSLARQVALIESFYAQSGK